MNGKICETCIQIRLAIHLLVTAMLHCSHDRHTIGYSTHTVKTIRMPTLSATIDHV